MRRFAVDCLVFAVAMAGLAISCGDDDSAGEGERDAGRDSGQDSGPEPCESDRDCSDGLFCNGEERCDPGAQGADDRGCVQAQSGPCAQGQTCDEAAKRCVGCGDSADADGDGHDSLACGGDDCDDNDPNRYPGNREVCDDGHRDEDCDPTTFGLRDVDADESYDAECCNREDDDSLNCGDDCDDTTFVRQPHQVEICDSIDNDCDGQTDEEENDVPWYPDADGDGYGVDSDDPTISCAPIEGHSLKNTDCDDSDPARRPAQIDLCDATDNNCDGDTDEEVPCGISLGETVGPQGGSVGRDVRGRMVLGVQVPEGALQEPVEIWVEAVELPVELPEGYEAIGPTYSFRPHGTRFDKSVLIALPALAVQTWELHVLRLDGPDDMSWEVLDGVSIESGVALIEVDSLSYFQVAKTAGVEPDIDAGVDSGAAGQGGTGGSGGSEDAGTECEEGWKDCNGGTDGCETPLNTLTDCGDCDTPCGFDNAVASCATGVCEFVECDTDFDDCNDELSDGCETDLSGQLNCGACGRQCAVQCSAADCVGAKQVASGERHTCALLTDGTVRCWGYNGSGQLGDGTTANSPTPVAVSGLNDVAEVSVGYEHSCARLNDGTVSCWGDNNNGRLGDGTDTASPTPVVVSGLSGAAQISVGYSHTCAALTDGTARCWGVGTSGRLGDGNSTDSPTPVGVAGLSGVAQISAGTAHTCAALTDGTARCWGSAANGRLGNGTTAGSSPTPAVVSGLEEVAEVSAGDTHSCARLTDGTARCWGSNGAGRLGDGTTVNSPTAVVVAELSGVAEVSAGFGTGSAHTCARLQDGSVKCWGGNGDAQLGDGTTVNSATPVAVQGLDSAAQISAGTRHTCAVLADESVTCWGDNTEYQLGRASYSVMPSQLLGLSSVEAVAAGRAHNCVLRQDGTVRCWGDNEFGQLGDGLTTTRAAPMPALDVAGVIDLAAGGSHTCAALSEEAPRCWGDNSSGQLGDGTTASSTTAVEVTGISAAVAEIQAGGLHSCTRHGDGTVSCWGDNEFGQLGDSTTESRSSPVSVSGLSDVTALAVGYRHGCALGSDGTVQCWGENSSGQLGDETTDNTSSPVTVSGLADADALAAGYDHTCALIADGTVQCWGQNADGQLGDSTLIDSATPVAVKGLTNAASITAGYHHNCALMGDGTIQCWGQNTSGQLGDGTAFSRSQPVAAIGIANASSVQAGGAHTCAVLQDSTVRCWGDNASLQLGRNISPPQRVVW